MNKQPFKQFSRQHDEAVLEWITRIESGESARAVAVDWGMSPATCRRAVKAVWGAML